MRRKDREMTEEFAKAVADTCDWAVVSMITPEGAPYGIPVSIVREADVLYFHCALEGKKADALRENPRVSVSCVGAVRPIAEKFTTAYDSAILEGEASEVVDQEEKVHALRILCQRYAASNMDHFDEAIERSLHRTGIWKIQILSITGKQKKFPVKS